jgi:hypothetical protein
LIPETLTTKVVGVSFNKNYPQNIFNLSNSIVAGDVELSVERELDNPSDKSAIKILKNGEFLGYVPMLIASSISSEIDSGKVWSAEIEEVLISTHNTDKPGLKILLWRNQ